MIFITFILSVLATLLPFLQAYGTPIPRTDSSSMDVEDIASYLYYHNAIRLLHGAAPLTWDYDLAAGAQAWASACNFKHTDGVLSADPYGENLAAATGSFGIMAAVESFVGDEDYDPFSPTFSDFTQVVWKDTTSLACAYNTQCDSIFPGSTATLHVCLYNPPGNVIGQAEENVGVF